MITLHRFRPKPEADLASGLHRLFSHYLLNQNGKQQRDLTSMMNPGETDHRHPQGISRLEYSGHPSMAEMTWNRR
jgi:hypothetical protein